MICLFGFTLNIAQAFETTWTQLVAFYVSTDSLLSSLQHYSGELSNSVALSLYRGTGMVCLMHNQETSQASSSLEELKETIDRL